MNSKAMCENTSDAEANRERVANGYGNAWHREQEAILEGVPIGETLPSSLRTYDLPMVSPKTYRPSRLSDN